jgi:hypothetical protein
MGFLGDIAKVLTPIGQIFSVIGGALTIFQAFKPPKIPKIEIPKDIFSKIESRIASITPISEEARKLVTDALAKFREGILDPRYKSQLDLAYQQKRAQAQAMLAARGLTGSSIEQEVINEIDRWYQQTYYDLLNQQLKDALTMAGLSTADIDALMKEISAYTSVLQAQALAGQTGALMELGRTIGLATGIETLTKGLEGLSKPTTPLIETPTITTGVTDLSEIITKPEYTLIPPESPWKWE